jgi:microcystin-dependent protein
MSQCFVGEIRLISFLYAPVGWAMCDGHTVAIAQYNMLYTLIGTTYGGDGQVSFGLPNLQGRLPVHQGTNGASTYGMGQVGGAEAVTITPSQFPAHNHSLTGTASAGGSNSPGNNVLANLSNVYTDNAPSTPMIAGTLSTVTYPSQPHDNRQPYQVLNWIIALTGIYPGH